MDLPQYEKLFKVVLVGNAGVGKTNLLLRLTEDKFNPDTRATIGVGFGNKLIDVDGHAIKLQVWDTAGQERFRATPSAYYRGARLAAVVFDVTDRDSFEKVSGGSNPWLAELDQYADRRVLTVLIGNKIDDAKNRSVTTEEAMALATSHSLLYFETSCKDGTGIHSAFQQLAREMFQATPEEIKPSDTPTTNNPHAQASALLVTSTPITLTQNTEEKKGFFSRLCSIL